MFKSQSHSRQGGWVGIHAKEAMERRGYKLQWFVSVSLIEDGVRMHVSSQCHA